MATRDHSENYNRYRSAYSSSHPATMSLLATAPPPPPPPHPIALQLSNLIKEQHVFNRLLNTLASLSFDDGKNKTNYHATKSKYNELIRETQIVKNAVQLMPSTNKIDAALKKKFCIELQEIINNFMNQRTQYKTILETVYPTDTNFGIYETRDPPALDGMIAYCDSDGRNIHGRYDSEIERREGDIRQLARDIHQLSNLFKELDTIIIHQGTIIDRIDHNMDCAIVRIDNGTSNLVVAGETQRKSKLPFICISLLMVLILICVVVIVIKTA